MIKKLIKDNIPKRSLEKIFRAKQFVKDSSFLKGKYDILPTVSHRIENEVIPLSPISNLTPQAWRNLLAAYDKASSKEQYEFREHVKIQIVSDANSYQILSTGYIKHIFKGHNLLYLDFLATAMYVAGDLQKAFDHFSELNKLEPTDVNTFYMARCLMHIASSDEEIELLENGIKKYPQADLLHLSLANAHFRAFNTETANNCLARVVRIVWRS